MATLDIPSDTMLPMPELDELQYRIELSKALKEEFIKMRQVFSEIESKLP